MNYQEAEELLDNGFTPVPPGNPKVKKLADHKARYISLSKLDSENTLFCKWCCKRPIMSSRHKYCSTACILSADIFCFPGKYWSREYIKKRDGTCCNVCKIDFGEREWARDEWDVVRIMNIDHIIPIFQGGTALGSENLQILCDVCHKQKSIEERRKK